VFGSHKHWVSVTGYVVEMQLLPGRAAPHPKLFVVELQPADSAPIRAEIRLNPGDHDYYDLYFCTGDTTGFLYNPDKREARFDTSDPRNSMSAHVAAGDAWASAPDLEDYSGPPWLVPGTCPGCHKRVDQTRASMDNQPHCPSCLQPLPAYPLVTTKQKHKDKHKH